MPTSQLQLPLANHSSLRDSKAYGAGLCKFHVPCNVFLLGKVHVFQSRIQKFLTPRFGETPTSSLYQFENIYQQYEHGISPKAGAQRGRSAIHHSHIM